LWGWKDLVGADKGLDPSVKGKGGTQRVKGKKRRETQNLWQRKGVRSRQKGSANAAKKKNGICRAHLARAGTRSKEVKSKEPRWKGGREKSH